MERRRKFIRSFTVNWELYLMSLPVIVYFFVFKYIPMPGVQIAFKKFSAMRGIWGSDWVGFKHFERFFSSYTFWPVILNTLGISLYSIAVLFPAPIIFALLINECTNKRFRKTVQTVTYIPHFLSTVVLCGMVIAFLSPSTGVVNHILRFFGKEPIYFMTEVSMFKSIYVLSGLWQGLGWGSLIYVAALSSIDVELYEAARMDGASRFRQLLHITLPFLIPTATIQLILTMGNVMSVGFEKVFLLQNDVTKGATDVISTYTYRVGIELSDYSYSTAIGLFNSVINFILLVIVNGASKRFNETSLW